VQERLGVYPLWNCAARLPDAAQEHFGGTHLVDIGIYGEPAHAGYRHVRDMRALQTMADAPSLWGMSYLSWDEIRATDPERFEQHDRVRRAYHAEGAFLDLKDKVNPFVYLVIPVALLLKLAFPRPSLRP
jgi:hypothetical protein